MPAVGPEDAEGPRGLHREAERDGARRGAITSSLTGRNAAACSDWAGAQTIEEMARAPEETRRRAGASTDEWCHSAVGSRCDPNSLNVSVFAGWKCPGPDSD